MPHTTFMLQMPDGECETHALTPAAGGPAPAVLMYMDGIGMRPALIAMAERIAAEGYHVLLPDLFYRIGFRAPGAATLFADPAAREDWLKRVIPSATSEMVMRDTEVLIDRLQSEPAVKSGPIGITGYCMGGRLALYAAGHFGDSVACAAAFHPGGVATDRPDSPHRLAPQVTAKIYIGRASEDAGFDDAQKERLERAYNEARVDFRLETYPARHGWVPSDTPVHDPAQAERHYDNLFGLLRQSLT